MGDLILKGGTSGQITVTPTAVAGTNTLTLPAATGTVALTASPTFTGTTTTGAQSVGGNITFSAADAGIIFNKTGALVNSTLNDYETGTWTPTILFGGASTGNVYSDQVGRYVKCGQSVTCVCYVRISTKGSATGGLQIGGLPFTTNNTTNLYSSSPIWSNGLSSLTGALVGLADPNSTRISVYQYAASGSGTGATNTNCNNGTDFSIAFTYTTTS